MQGGSAVFLARQDAAPEEANPSVPPRSLKICKNAFAKKNTFFSIPAKETDPRTQTETVPEGAKIHRASSLFENFIHFLAAHLPRPVPTLPSLPDPTSPHVKDYPGLGDPNTLK